MATIARTTGALIGTDESTGVTIATTATSTGSNVDLLGDDASTGEVEIFLCVTSTVTAGTIDVTLIPGRRSNSSTIEYSRLSVDYSVSPTNGTQKLSLTRRPAPRFLGVTVKNNATGANSTNVAVLYTLTKFS